MRELQTLQRKLLAAIIDDKTAEVAEYLTMDGERLEQRLNIHRRNYRMLMTDVLAHTYPLVGGLLKREDQQDPQENGGSFRRLAAAYLRRHPPTSPLLADYGQDFADFLAAAAPTGVRKPLSRLAKLEWRAAQIRRMPFKPSLTAADLKGLSPLRLAELKPSLQEWVGLFREDYDFFAVWRAHRDKKPPPPFAPAKKPYYFILSRDKSGVFLYDNPDEDVWRLAQALKRGRSLGEAAITGGRLQRAFSFLLTEGLLRCEL